MAAAEREREKTTDSLKDHLKVDDPFRKRRSSNASVHSKGGGRPKSMVTYDKGPPRDIGFDKTIDNRELGPGHKEYVKFDPDKFEPRFEKTGLRGFRPGPTQTGLYSHRRCLEA